MTPQTVATYIPGDKSVSNMIPLSASVSLYRPLPKLSVNDPAAPKLVLLATWMDARDTHIAKYITRYQTLYPTSMILVAKSSFWTLLSPRSARRELEPAVEVIRDLLPVEPSSGDTKPQILIHIFSNAGSCVLYHLYDLYTQTAKGEKGNGRLLPKHVTIFDSGPGRWNYSVSTQGILTGVPAGLLRWVALPLVHLLGLFWWIKYILLKVPDELHTWGLAHNDSGKVRETCRAYIYSEADEFVNYRAVEEHAERAEAKGFVVARREKFPGSPHVAHARSDPEKYWSVIGDTWKVSQK